jgi:hypothetical protein
MVDNKTDLSRVKAETFAKVIHRLRTDEKKGAGKEQIKAWLQWYREHYGEQYTPPMYKRDDLYNRWAKHQDAMKRWFRDNGLVESVSTKPTVPHDLRNELIGLLEEDGWEFGDHLDQDHLDQVLGSMGRKPGSVRAEDVA